MKKTPTRHPAIRFPLAAPDLGGNEQVYVRRALRAGHVSGAAPEIAEFEAAFATALELPHAIATASGTAALHLALTALGIGRGDEVLVPDLTYVATANVVRYTGATPVLVDVDPQTWTIDPERAARRIGPRTRAIIAVHVYGNPADLGQLGKLARANDVALIEDAAEAHGATWRGRPVGGIGDIGCFSFFANKVLTTGEGGLVTSRSVRLARRLRALRDQAKSARRPYFHAELAFSYRMSALQAALGVAQVERLAYFLERRAAIARWYRQDLAGLHGWREPVAAAGAVPVNWLYSGTIDGWTRRRRDRCLGVLRAQGIDARPLFVPMSALPEYREDGGPVAHRISDSGLSLPVYTRMRRGDVRTIAAAFAAAADGARG